MSMYDANVEHVWQNNWIRRYIWFLLWTRLIHYLCELRCNKYATRMAGKEGTAPTFYAGGSWYILIVVLQCFLNSENNETMNDASIMGCASSAWFVCYCGKSQICRPFLIICGHTSIHLLICLVHKKYPTLADATMILQLMHAQKMEVQPSSNK